MKNVIQLKEAKKLKTGEYILKPQHPNGILLARKITATKVIDKGKKVELKIDDGMLHVMSDDKIFHTLSVDDMVAVVKRGTGVINDSK